MSTRPMFAALMVMWLSLGCGGGDGGGASPDGGDAGSGGAIGADGGTDASGAGGQVSGAGGAPGSLDSGAPTDSATKNDTPAGTDTASMTGDLDPTFMVGRAGGGVHTIALQPDGKLIVGGEFTNWNGVERHRIVRLNADGTVDTTFVSAQAVTNNHVVASVLQPDGKLVIGGNFNSAGMVRIGRLNPDGSRDTTFNMGGAGAEGSVSVMLRQPDGKILVGGFTGEPGHSDFDFAVVRLNADGST
ncbi:MAG TPA: delta-60 repeat domain-containing protein, partial [Polyangia bacterium]